MSHDPPAIRWMPDGEHEGFYIYAPVLNCRWRRVLADHRGVHDWLEAPPAGAQALYDYDTVADLLDTYRDTLLQYQEAIREDGDRCDAHEGAKAEVLAELRDSEDYAMIVADQRYASSTADSPVRMWRALSPTAKKLHRYPTCPDDSVTPVNCLIRESECASDYAVTVDPPHAVLGELCVRCERRNRQASQR